MILMKQVQNLIQYLKLWENSAKHQATLNTRYNILSCGKTVLNTKQLLTHITIS